TLTGDDERRTVETLVECERVEHELRARHQTGIEERDQARAEAARRARAPHVANVAADESLDDVGIARECRVELTHDLRRCALLRSEHGACALGTEERV